MLKYFFIFIFILSTYSNEPPDIKYEIVHDDYKSFINSGSQIGSDSIIEAPTCDFYLLYKSIVYPNYAKNNFIEGKVVVRTLVDTLGRVLKVEIEESDNHYLNSSALEVVFATVFKPAIKTDGKKVSTYILIPIRYKLKKR